MAVTKRPPHLLPGQNAALRSQILLDSPLELWKSDIARSGIFGAEKLAALAVVLGVIFSQVTFIVGPAEAAPDEIMGTVFEDIAGDGLADGAVGGVNNPGVAGVPVSLFRDEASAQTVDSAGDVGQYASIAIGSDGNPVVAYGDVGTGDLELLHCEDPSCSSFTTRTLESAGSVGQSVSLAIGADGFPVISHYDWGNLDLRVYKCDDVACTSGTGIAVDTVGSQGNGSSIAVGTDGLPIISYFDGTAYDLKVAHCNDAACSTATITAIDTASTTGAWSSIAIGSDGNAVVSYKYIPSADLKVAHCDNVACTSGTSTTVDTAGDVGGSSSIAQGSDGFPAVAYFDLTNRNLKFAHCTNLICTAKNIATVDSAGDVGYNPSVAIGLDGNPIIAHYDFTNTALKLTYCDNLDCSSSSSTTPDSAGNVGSDPSITLDAGGAPVVAYFDQGNYDLKLATAANGAPDAGDTFLSTMTTDANGDYTFSGLSAGDYLVAVESRSVAATAGYNTAQGDSWAEQTYGPSGSLCANGSGGTLTRSTAGACYGGADATSSDVYDSASPDVTTAEHVAGIAAGAPAANFGFSFNVVTNTEAGDARDADPAAARTVQGSLRQYIQNANAITDASAMRFVPAEPTNATDGTNSWWRIPVTELLPTITDDDTAVDGRAFDSTDGSTVLDSNTAQIGSGVAVGSDGTYTTPTLDPELEIWNDRGTAVLATGLVFEARNSTLRHVSIWGFGDSAGTFDTNVKFGTNYGVDPDYTGTVVEFNVIGTGPVSFADPGVANRSGQKNLTIRENDDAIVRDNLIGYAGGVGVDFNSGSNSGTVLRNEVRGNGILNPSGNPVGVWVSGSVTGNLITDNASGVFSGPTLWITYEDNTITANGWGGTRPHGIQVLGSPTTIRRNIIADNAGSGVVPDATDTDVYITRNSMYGNGTVTGSIGIDLLASGDDSKAAPFVTLNDAGDGDTGSNGLLNYPVLDTARIEGSDLVLTGWAGPGTTIEFYLADGDPSGFGEGQTWLISKVEGSADDTDAATGTYGPGAVNGIAQGTDTTNRFAFTVPTASLAAAVAGSDLLTALATSGTNSSEFGGQVTVTGGFVVNSSGDADDANAGNGICETSTPGQCTLRAAIEEANAFPGTDTINFDIPTSDNGYTASPVSFTIQPQSLLPAISTPMVLDASTQPEYATANRPVIEVDGADVSAGEENGFYLTGGGATVRGFVLNNWGDDAIDVEFNDGNTIVGNYIGTNVTGTAAKANAWGINLKTANNVIGGTTAADRNVVSGNLYDGFYIYNATATGNLIQGNYIGINAAGTAAVSNGGNGLYIWNAANNNTIGGTVAGAGNVISGNSGNGIELTGIGTDSNTVVGNYVGTNAAGTVVVPNTAAGIELDGADANQIGGTSGFAGNLISGNSSVGVWITGGSSANVLEGNTIGLNASETAALPNARGITINSGAVGNTIGGTAGGAGNVLSGNSTEGILLSNATTTGNVVQGNYVGANSSGVPFGNVQEGISIISGAYGNLIGGDTLGQGNLIANNADGVTMTVTAGVSNAVLGNSIHSNTALGIDLNFDGVTANDPGDGDSGANDLLNFPVITSAIETGGTVNVVFDLDVPNGNYRVEFFDNTAADPSGNGEGETYVDALNVVGHPGGSAGYGAVFPGSVGDILTATLTEGNAAPYGSTSEFSAAFTVTAGNNPPTFDQDLGNRSDAEAASISLSSSATDPDVGDTLTYSATGLPLGLSIASGTGLISGLVNHAAAAASPYSVEIAVCDDGTPSLCDTDTFTWTVTNVPATAPYLVAGTGGGGGGDDLLTTVDETSFDPATNEVDIGIGTGTSGIEAAAVEPLTGDLYATDGGQLGVLNVDSGVFTPIGAGLGTGSGEFGAITFDDVNGMAFHPLTGYIWAVHTRPGQIDVLLVIDPATGAHIPDHFGAGVDYIKLRQHGGATDYTSLAIDPTDWQLYGVVTDGAGTDYLVRVRRRNGNARIAGSLSQPLTDLSFDATGQLWGVDGGNLYQVNKGTAVLDSGRAIDNGFNYGALAFAVPPAFPPSFEGTVFEDIDGDALAAAQFPSDVDNPGVSGVTVNLYRDDGTTPGEPDAADTLFDTKTTGPTGKYFFEGVPDGTYYVAIDSTTVSPSASGSGWAEQTYGPVGAATFSGSYSYAVAAGPLYGGKQATVSDGATNVSTAEHLAQLNLSGGAYVEDVDFGFSFNVIVNTRDGDDDIDPGRSVQGSFRQFIDNSNGITGTQTSAFVIPTTDANWNAGATSFTVSPTSVLPAVSGSAVIDATTQSQWSAANRPVIEIDGSAFAGSEDGLDLSGGTSEVRGLAIGDFPDYGVHTSGGADHIIVGNHIGTDAQGTSSRPNRVGITAVVDGVAVGGTGVYDGNLISGNTVRGIDIGVAADGVTVVGNIIGLDATGAALSNDAGITVNTDATNTVVGGPTPAERNIVSGNTYAGIRIAGALTDNTTVQGNWIGTDLIGTGTVPNGHGIVLDSSPTDALIGGTNPGEGNVIRGNTGDAVRIASGGTDDVAVLGNEIADNGGLGIDIGPVDGATPNDGGDVDAGPNDILNYPVITSAVESGGTVTVAGTFDVPAGNYRFELFTNSAADPTGYGEGENLVGSAVIAHTGSGSAPFGAAFPGSAGDIITVTVTEDLGGSYGSTSEFSAAYTVSAPNSLPTAVAGGPYTIAEGEDLVLDGSGSSDPDTDPLTYNWDVDNDGLYDDATGVNPTVTWATLVGLGIDDDGGPLTIGLEVDDSVSGTDTATGQLTVTNTVPTISVGGSGSVVVGTPYTVTLGASDPGADTVIQWTINWGDGSIETIPGNPGTYDHTYAIEDRTYDITASVVDEDGTWWNTDIVVPYWEAGNMVIRYDSQTGVSITDIGTPSGIVEPHTVAIGPDGFIYVSDDVTDTIERYNPATNTHDLTFITANQDGLDEPRGITFGPDGDLFVASYLTHQVLRYNPDGSFDSIFVPAGEGGLSGPTGLEFGPNGDLYVTDTDQDTVERYDGKGGTHVATFSSHQNNGIIEDLAFAPDGSLYVSVLWVDRIDHVDSGGTIIGSVAVTAPTGLGFGPDGMLWAGSMTTDSVVRINPATDTVISTPITEPPIAGPTYFDFIPEHQVRCDPAPDTTPPVITLLGANPQTIEVGDPYVELGATALDDVDGDISGSIVIDASAVDTAVVGSYTVTYNVSDTAGNAATQVFRDVDVVDTTSPLLTLLGANPQTIEVGDAYVELGATASDVGDGDLTDSIVINSSAVNTAVVGSYAVTYDVADSSGNPASGFRTVNVVDTTAPVIILVGANPQTIEVGDAYVELGATATDVGDGDISGSIVIDASGVDTAVVGSYSVTYDVTDSQGNAAVTVTRTVDVVDTGAPVITLLGANPQTIEVGVGYTELGATAFDVGDGDISGSIVIDASGVDTSVVGSYSVTYDVTDSQGNAAATVTRTVDVVDTTAPVITLVGANPQTIEFGDAYTELGAAALDVGDGDISGSIVIDTSGVDTAVVGSYSVTYDVTDSQGNAAVTVSRTVDVVDTTAPVITLVGANPQAIEVGSGYTELGATAFDVGDGDISGSIVIDASGVDTAVVGSYSVTYDVTDSQGNAAVTVTRTVDVVDTGAPVITLVGANPQTIEVGVGYTELGATAFDVGDGDLTGSIVIDASGVDTAVVGSYSVTYDVTDSQGNAAATVTRTVDVVDTGAPVITLIGANPQTIEVGDAYVELGATAFDSGDGDISGSIVIDASAVNTTLVGSYVVTYDVVDSAGNPATAFRIVDVVDTTAPVITLLGADPQTIEVGGAYVELGATAFDVGDGDISGSIVIDATGVNTAVIGSYSVTYDVTDSHGNAATTVSRTVDVVDMTAPVISLLGANPQTIEVGSGYVELGATALDNNDGDITGSIVIDASGVNTAAVGTYSVTYDVTDSQGNAAATVTRTVDVVDTTAPVITLLGSNPQTIEVGSGYTEMGATAFDVGDGDLTGSIVVDASAVNTALVGSYVVIYDVVDSAGNPATAFRIVDVVDTTAPVITLLGANPQTMEVGSGYIELVATALDNYDGDITGSIVIDATGVNTAAVGSYSVTYDVTDSEGNAATTVTRTVDVVDTTIPVITLTGPNLQVVEVGTPYIEQWATALDNYDGDITGSIVIDATSVNTAVVGSYSVTYDVADSQGNAAATVTRAVDVVDTTAPIITLLGSNPQLIEVGSPYTELGATALDNYDGDITGSIVIDATGVNTAAVGSYSVTYDVTDSEGNAAATVTRAVDVVDTTAPIITLLGANPQTIEVGSSYTELGATAFDSYDGDVTGSIVIDTTGVNTAVVGSYSVTYDVTDSEGNAAVPAIRTVEIVDTTAPVITLVGANPQQIPVSTPYAELGATAADNYDGDISGSIVIDSSAVNTAVVGSYPVTYDVTDSEGNAATQVIRTVEVLNVSPVLAVLLDQSVDEGALLTFTATATDPDPTDVLTFSLSGEPAGASITPSGDFSWTPAEMQGPGVYSFDVIVTDSGAPQLADSQTISVTVAEVNQPPVLGPAGPYPIDEQTMLTFIMPVSDGDLPANGLLFSLSGEPAGATIDPGTGAFQWTPSESQGPGTYVFDVSVVDDGTPTLGDTASVTVPVAEVNRPPAITNPGDQASVEDDVVALPVVATDPDQPADTLTFSATGLPDGLAINPGTAEITGVISFAANAGSPFTTTITATDDGSPNESAFVSFAWTVADANRAPVGVAESVSGAEDTTISIAVLANDTDPDGDTLSVLSTTQPVNGAVAIVGDTVEYTPNPNYFGVDSFAYTSSDGRGGTGTATVSVTVTPVNDAPSLSGLAPLTVAEGTLLTATAVGTDVDRDALAFSLVAAPTGASIDAATGVFSWTPSEAQGPGVHTFDVVVTDNGSPGLSAAQSVTVSVVEVNRPPLLVNPGDQVSVEGETVSLPLTAVDPDVPAGTVQFSATGLPPGLAVDPATGVVSGLLPFDAAAGSPYAVTVTATDNGSPQLSSDVQIEWQVRATNRAPVAADMTVFAAAGVPGTLVLRGSDPDGDALTFSITADPTKGTLRGGPRLYDYTPAPGASGSDSFTFTVSDGDLQATGTVTIEITPNAAPIGEADGYSVRRGGVLVVDAPGVLDNDTDPEGGSLTATVTTYPSHGSLSLQDDGSFVYRNHGDDAGRDTFTYVATDGLRISDAVTITIDIERNIAPTVRDDTVTLDEDQTVTFYPLDNDYDVNDESVTIANASVPSNGSLERKVDGAFRYEPDANWNGTEVITYQASDGELASTGTITITVVPVNDPPTAEPVEVTGNSGETVVVDLRPYVDDIDGDELTFTLEAPSAGTAVMLEPGVFEVSLSGVVRDLSALTFVASDPAGEEAESFVTVVVRIPAELVGVPSLVSDGTNAGPDGSDGSPGSSPGDLGSPPLLNGLRLMVGSVLDTFQALRVPFLLVFLIGLASLYLGFSKRFAFSSTATALPMVARKRVDIIMAQSGAGVAARTEPGTHESVVHRFESDETGIVTTGARSMLRGEVWVEVETPEGDAWVNAEFLTEQVPDAVFTEDERPHELIAEFVDAIYRNADLLDSTKGHDLHVAYYAPPIRFSVNSLKGLLRGASVYWWWRPDGDTPKCQGTFDETVGESITAAFRNQDSHVREPNVPTPREFVNMHSLVIGTDDGWKAWRVFFRYENDEPSIAGLMREAHPNPAAVHGRIDMQESIVA